MKKRVTAAAFAVATVFAAAANAQAPAVKSPAATLPPARKIGRARAVEGPWRPLAEPQDDLTRA